MLQQSANGIAPGKVILLGEHAVVYGRPAIAAAIDRFVRIDVTLGAVGAGCGEGSIRVEAPCTLSLSSPGESEPSPQPTPPPERPAAAECCDAHAPIHQGTLLRQAIDRAAAIFQLDPARLHLWIHSELPSAVGLGSSAALSVALVRALASLTHQKLDASAVCGAAFELERIFHGFPSGIDNTVATFRGLVRFAADQTHRRLASAAQLPLVIALAGGERSTGTVVKALRERWQRDPRECEAVFDAIAALTEDGAAALRRGDLPALGDSMNRNHALLQELRVSTAELDTMVQLARGAGALGAKLTGGGGGGAIICLCENDLRHARNPGAGGGPQALLDAFTAAGWRAFNTTISAVRGDDAEYAPKRNDNRAYA